MTRQQLTISVLSILVLARLFFSDVIVYAANNSDIPVLNCALHIEHLSRALYTEGLARFSVQDFVGSGLEPWMYGRLQEILQHEEAHVEFLQGVVSEGGGEPVARCVYNFPYSDPKSFVETASKLETIGTAAYHGATAMLTDEQYISASGSIFSIEARHSGWIDSSIRKGSAWSGAFGVPLNCGQILTLVSPYIESCPYTEPSLLPTAYPPLTISNDARPNEITSLSFAFPQNSNSSISSSDSPSPSLFATFLTSNAGALSAPVILHDEQGTLNAQVRVPENIRGDVFVIITTDAGDTDPGHVAAESIVAGPALVRVGFDSEGRLG
ncbi:ferritin-like domain-containing protein [Lentinula aciculospora]|uniref:Ferritin-like domain-containing protein n=1 Tax=Lentinula aciculospora TaxID=153920 RepID=A0A9W9AX68_9AGAR|nr:ferritin-like domain-containing protein [Lentinula aciculospora]